MVYRRSPPPPAPVSPGLPDTIDPTNLYRVQLLTPAPFGGVTLSVSEQHVMTGAALIEVKDFVYGAIVA